MTRTSLWRDRHPARPPGGDRLEPHRWDVVVVGAGLTGLTTALLLARAGRSVLVVEARAAGAGTTGGSTAKISLLQGTTLSRIARRQSRENLRRYVEANREALAWLDRYAAEHGVDLQRRPAFTYATTEGGRRAVERELEVAQGAGLPVTWSETPELPFETRGAARLDDQAQVDPLELVAALVADLDVHGGALAEGVRVRAVHGHAPLRVETSSGNVEADVVLVATNMPVLDRGGFFARAVPQRSYAAAFAAPGSSLRGMYLSADSPTRSLRSTSGSAGDLLLVGGNGHATGRGGATRPRVDDLVDWTRRHFGLDEPTHTWSAQDYTPASGLPYVGTLLPGSDDLLVAGGYSKWGMTNAVSAALALSGRLLGGHLDWAHAYDPWAGHQLAGGVPDGVRYNAEVGVELTRGWIAPGWRAAPGQEAEVRRGGLRPPTAVCRVDGRESRSSAVCAHLGGIVRWNDAEQTWDCPLHGSRFNPDGDVLEGPATSGLRSAGA
jgi:glycine/D-amino acid oxidase-like deaminating enzyme/nitrite reductase/ring-hydroxylating ferredoxin subunit